MVTSPIRARPEIAVFGRMTDSNEPSGWFKQLRLTADLEGAAWDLVLIAEDFPDVRAVVQHCLARQLKSVLVVDPCRREVVPPPELGVRMLARPVSREAAISLLEGRQRRAPKTVVFTSRLGRVGKTSISLNVSAMAALRLGVSTLWVECAREGPIARTVLEAYQPSVTKSIYHLARDVKVRSSSVAEAFPEHVHHLSVRGAQRALDLLLAPPDDNQWDELWLGKPLLTPDIYADIFETARASYDLVVIDTSQQYRYISNEAAHGVADMEVVVLVPQDDAREIRDYLPKLVGMLGGHAWIRQCPNMIDLYHYREQVAAALDLPITPLAVVPEDRERFARATRERTIPVISYFRDQVAPRALASPELPDLIATFQEMALNLARFASATPMLGQLESASSAPHGGKSTTNRGLGGLRRTA